MPNILKQRDSFGEIVRILTEVEKPELGQACIVRWTNCNNTYDAPGVIAGVNAKSVRVTLTQDVPYPPHYAKTTPAYPKGRSIKVPLWPQATHNNGVFSEIDYRQKPCCDQCGNSREDTMRQAAYLGIENPICCEVNQGRQ